MKKYTDQDIETIKTMKADGKSNKEIGHEINRPAQHINAKWQTLKKNPQPKSRPYKTREYKKPEATPVHRPMIALVGTPAEVTATIRELFS